MALDFEPGDAATARQALTVSLLNRAVAELLSRGFPLVRVIGEVSGFTRAASGHWYFALKDDRAQVRCVMFRSRNALAVRPPRDGDAVEVLAQVTLYEPRGEYQLTIESMQAAGLGRLYEEFVRRRERLAAAGLFDAERKRALPALPHAVGVVTSLQAAALRDVVTTLARRAPYCRVIVYPVPVQGEGAAERIAAMLATASARAEVDVLLLVRGGGSLEDLWAFNEEVVARALRACRIPVVVGVGHESDFTIADFAADVRAPTPTAAAEIAAPDAAVLRARVGDAARRLRQLLRAAFEARQQRLDYALRTLATPRAALAGMRARLEQLVLRAGRAQQSALRDGRERLAALGARLPRPDTGRPRQSVHAAAVRLATFAGALLQSDRARLARLAGALAQLDPRAVLARGYSIVRDAHGRAVTSVRQLTVGDALALRFGDGAAAARVERVELERDPPAQ
jgi:exodeoxyribonuclease VII large subunit